MSARENIETVLKRLNEAFPDGDVRVNGKANLPEHYRQEERTGTHLKVAVKSAQFSGMPLLEQHRTVHQSLADLMQLNDGFIHALTIKTEE